MAVALVAQSGVITGSSSLILENVSGNVGDLLLAFAFHKGTGYVAPTTLNGYTYLGGAASTNGFLMVFYKLNAGTPDGTIQWSSGLTSSSVGSVARFSGVDSRQPFFCASNTHIRKNQANTEGTYQINWSGDFFDPFTSARYLMIYATDNDATFSNAIVRTSNGNDAAAGYTVLGENYTTTGTDCGAGWAMSGSPAAPGYGMQFNVLEQGAGTANNVAMMLCLQAPLSSVPLAGSVSDDFNDNSLNSAKWTSYVDASNDVFETNAQLVEVTTGAQNSIARVVGTTQLDLEGSSIFWKWTDTSGTGHKSIVRFIPTKKTDTSPVTLYSGLSVVYAAGYLQLWYGNGSGTDQMQGQVSHSGGNDASPWIKLEMTTDYVNVYKSSDGSTWGSSIISITRSSSFLNAWDGFGWVLIEVVAGSTTSHNNLDNWNTAGGPPTWNIDGSLAVTATLTSAAAISEAAAAALSVTATLTAGAGISYGVAGTLAATATLTGAITASKDIGGALASTATLTAAGVRTQPITGGLSATATLTSGLTASYVAGGTLAASVTLTAGVQRTQPITGGLSATATLTATETLGQQLAGTLSTTATLTSAGAREQPITGGLSATATLTATETLGQQLAGSLPVIATLTAGGVREQPLAGALSVTATLTSDLDVTVAQKSIDGTLAVTASLTSGILREAIVEGGLAATATLTAGAEVGQKEIGGTLAVTATLTSALVPERLVAGGLASTATLIANAIGSYVLDGTLATTATLTSVLLPERLVTGGLSATATLTSDLVAEHPVVGSLVTTATITAGAEREALVATTLPITATLSSVADRTATFGGTLAITATLSSAALVEHLYAGTLNITATLTTEIWAPLITLVGTPQHDTAPGDQNVTLTFDVTPSEGDVTVLIGGHYSRGTAGPSTSGYSVAHYYTGGEPYFGVWYKRQGVTPDTGVVGLGSGTASDVSAYVSYVLRGVDPNNPLDAVAAGAVGLDPPSLDTITAGAFAIAATGLSRSSDQTPGSVAGYSNVVIAAG